jgi:hypothetical protein
MVGRRDAALDRGHAKDDRSSAADDRQTLTDGPEAEQVLWELEAPAQRQMSAWVAQGMAGPCGNTLGFAWLSMKVTNGAPSLAEPTS